MEPCRREPENDVAGGDVGIGAGNGYASVSLAIPNDAALIGMTFFGRWFVLDAGAPGGVAVSPAFQMTIFDANVSSPEASLLSTVSAASLALGLVAPESIVTGFGANLANAEAKLSKAVAEAKEAFKAEMIETQGATA